MFVMSMRMTRKKLLFALVLAACLTFAVFCFFSFSGQAEPAARPAGGTDSERIQYLAQFGWELSPKPLETKDVQIPQEFDKVYEPYNKLQLSQNFDLTPYRGKTVTRYTYAVTNYPDGVEDVRANLLVSGGEIIGGDICNVSLGGFMHGFNLEGTGLPFGQPVQSEAA